MNMHAYENEANPHHKRPGYRSFPSRMGLNEAWYYPDWLAVHLRLTGMPDSEQYRAANLYGVELTKAHGLQCWISDMRQAGVLDVADVEWTNTVLVDLALEAGILYLVQLKDNNPFSDANEEEWADTVEERGVQTLQTPSLEEAREWVLARSALNA